MTIYSSDKLSSFSMPTWKSEGGDDNGRLTVCLVLEQSHVGCWGVQSVQRVEGILLHRNHIPLDV